MTRTAAALALLSLVGCKKPPPPEPVGSCTWTQTAGECALVSTDVVDANSDDPTLAGLRLTYEWQGALPPGMHDKRKFVDWQVPKTRVEAARAHAATLSRLPCRVAVSNGPCPPYLAIDPAAVPAPPAVSAGEREKICPEDPPAPMNKKIAGVGTAALSRALPARLPGDWLRTTANASEAGSAGRWADEARALYTRKADQVQVVVSDMIRVCTGTAGSADILLDSESVHDPKATRRRENVHARSAVLVEWNEPGTARQLVLWIGDRCRVSLQGSSRTAPEEVIEVARALDLDALDEPCGRR